MSRFRMVCRRCAEQFGREVQLTAKDWLDSDLGNWSAPCQFCGIDTHLKEVKPIPMFCVVVEKEKAL